MSKEVIVRDDTGLHNEEWYLSLLDDLKAIETERMFNARIEVIQCNWELGERIFQENSRMERSKVYGKQIVANLANDLGKSESHIHSCVQFYKAIDAPTFDDAVSKLPEGKNVSWNTALKSLGIKKNTKPLSQKKSVKIDDAISVFKVWLVAHVTQKEDEITQHIGEFRQQLLDYQTK